MLADRQRDTQTHRHTHTHTDVLITMRFLPIKDDTMHQLSDIGVKDYHGFTLAC